MPLLTITEYARHRGCRLNAVQVAVIDGRIHRNPDGLIDSDVADAEWQDNTSEALARREPKPKPIAGEVALLEAKPGMTYTQARAVHESLKAQLTQFEVALREGTLVSRKDVEAETFRLFRMVRDACFNLPPRLATQLAAESDPHVVHQTLEAELRQIFEKFAEGKLE